MNLLTVLILYNDESEKLIPTFKQNILDRTIDDNKINFVEQKIEKEEEFMFKNKSDLDRFDSKYLLVANAFDLCELNQPSLDELEANDYDLMQNIFVIKSGNDYIFPLESEVNKMYYNKIIKVSHLRDLISYENTYFEELLYLLYLEKDISIGDFPLLYYTVTHCCPTLHNYGDEEIDDSITYTIDGIEYNANLQLKSIIPLAKEYLSARELYDMNYSASVNVPIIMSLIDNNKSYRMAQKIFLGTYSVNEIVNGEIIYLKIEDKDDMPPFVKILYQMSNDVDFGLNIIIDIKDTKKRDAVNSTIINNIEVPYKVYDMPKDKSDKDFINSLSYKYTWIISDSVEKVFLIEKSVQTNDCDFIIFGQERDKIRNVSELQEDMPSTENMWVKTDILKEQGTLDFKLEKGSVMFNIRKVYK